MIPRDIKLLGSDTATAPMTSKVDTQQQYPALLLLFVQI